MNNKPQVQKFPLKATEKMDPLQPLLDTNSRTNPPKIRNKICTTQLQVP
jgi:hypothetical protein